MADEFNKYKDNILNTEYIEGRLTQSGAPLCELVHIDDSNIKEVYYRMENGHPKYLVVVDIPNVFLDFTTVGEIGFDEPFNVSYRGLADLIREQVANALDKYGELDSVLESWTKLFPFKHWPETVEEYENYIAEYRLDYLGNLVKYNDIYDYSNDNNKISRICSSPTTTAGAIKYDGPFNFDNIGGAFDCWTYPEAYKVIGPEIGLI